MFLCPRYRAGLCDGRVVEVLLTCGFAGRRADRRTKAARIAPIRSHPRRRVAEQGILPRQPRRKTTIRGHGCTGSCDDPEVLPFLVTRAPITATRRAARSSSGYRRT